MTLASFAPTVNHLWQSTLFVGVVWLLARMLQENRAAIRYRLWMVASVKFLIPFSALVAAGSRLGWSASTSTGPGVWSTAVEEVLAPQPLQTVATSAAAGAAPSRVVAIALVAIWAIGTAIVLVSWWRQWRPIRKAVRRAVPAKLDRFGIDASGMRVLTSPDRLEPGIVGIWRPVLLLPDGIGDRLSVPQLDTILAHERCHLRRRDNLTAALHMAVEALFWFHPGVWWMESRLVEERERACDEAVLESGREPEHYATAILDVCRHYVESPLISAAGVTGANLKRRIEAIVENGRSRPLGAAKRSVLALAAALALAAPLVIGVFTNSHLEAQSVTSIQPATNSTEPVSFEAATVKPNGGVDRVRRAGFQPGGRFVGINVSLRMMLGAAYSSPDAMLPNFRIVGGPSWLDTDGFDVEAKAENDAPVSQLRLMLQALLRDRFQLTTHIETQQLPMFTLVVSRSDGRLGPQLRRSAGGCAYAAPAIAAGAANCNDRFGPARSAGLRLTLGDTSMATLAANLASRVGRQVVDGTKLPGRFDVDVEYTAATAAAAAGPAAAVGDAPSDGLSLFTALQEQLGLKLQPATGPVDVLVVDHVERLPSDSAQAASAAPPAATRSVAAPATAPVAAPVTSPVTAAVTARPTPPQPSVARLPAAAPAVPEASSAIAGTVTDAAFGDPLKDVSVEVVSDVPGEKPRTTTTDAAGAFRVDGLSPGIYIVTFTHQGWQTFKREGLNVDAQTTVRVDPKLKEGLGIHD